MLDQLLSKINNGEAVAGVMGLGYVGLPLAINIAGKGFSVIGFDTDGAKVKALNEGHSYIRYLGDDLIASTFKDGGAEATDENSRLSECDVILITVPTPLGPERVPDLSYVKATAEAIASHLRPGQLVVLESTTYPGTTEEVVQPILETSGLTHGVDFLLAYSPEREDPSNEQFSMATIPKVIGGVSEQAREAAVAFYSRIVETTVPVSSARVAEATKLLENVYRAVNIALVNELKTAFMPMDIDIYEVIAAAKTKPFGFMPFYPGPGLGGHCIPIDPFYLSWKAAIHGAETRFIELAGEVNTQMPDFVIERTRQALADDGKKIDGAKILILGLAYKRNIDDPRESPAFYLMDKLEHQGAKVSYNDPYIPKIGHTRAFDHLSGRESVEISGEFDCLIIATDHDVYGEIDFNKYDIPIIDTRNLLNSHPRLYRS